jgi:hypothetical protein
MSSDQPHVPPEEVQAFAFSVGKAIQNYGTIEYLVNELVAILVSDTLLATTIVKLGISKRLDLLSTLVERRMDMLAKQGWVADDLFEQTKVAFQERNKIAHNPYVIQESKKDKQVTVGIHVVRYHKVGTKEEWIDKAQLEGFTLASRELVVRFNQLLGCCKAP